ncbi:MAG: hypothetical protein AAF211_27190 [Myxococcota bacterium]
MKRWMIALPMLLAGACTEFESIEEACKGSVPGNRDASDEAIRVFERLGCYRRYAGLGQARLSPPISRAVQNHIGYLEENVSFEDWWINQTESVFIEQQGRVGFTGAQAVDRFDFEGYETDNQSIQTWSVIALFQDNQQPPETYIDNQIHHPLYRDALFAPGWQAGSYAEGTLEPSFRFGYLEAALFLPSGQKAFKPVSYPIQDQTGVPVAWNNCVTRDGISFGIDPGVPFDELDITTGYPVSFTFGSDDTTGGRNPLDIQVQRTRFVGPEGDVPHGVVLPGTYPTFGPNTSTVSLVPFDPLLPSTEYFVEIDVSWISRQNLTQALTFTTRASDETAGLCLLP